MGKRTDMQASSIEVTLPIAGDESLSATLAIPADASGCVAFAHGSGSSRHSPRNRLVASALHHARLATLLLDLLTLREEEDDRRTGRFRFDIDRLASRLLAATRWIAEQRDASRLPLGYFGASTGAAAALVAAARSGDRVKAVVSRGGRPDLAGDLLEEVRAATLLIVGASDAAVLRLNQHALAHLHADRELAIVPGATHLFEEAGALEEVARLSAAWFVRYLGVGAPR